MSFERKISEDSGVLPNLTWVSWQELIGSPADDSRTVALSFPLEQTALNIDSSIYSDYAWYETDFYLEDSVPTTAISIETQRSNGFLIFIDEVLVGEADDHLATEGPITFTIECGSLNKGHHKLNILSESFGYYNGIGWWSGQTGAKVKGITGDVVLSLGNGEVKVSLVDGREWRSFPGLHGENLDRLQKVSPVDFDDHTVHSLGVPGPTWSSSLFATPKYDPIHQALFLEITTGRGHLWLNGKDLGRYWNITRDGSDEYSQKYYFLPPDYLHADGNQNELVLFDCFGGYRLDKLVLSWIEASENETLLDEVDYPTACI